MLDHLAFQIRRTATSRTAESVHDLRIAIRKFVQTLRVFDPCFPGQKTRKIRRRLKKVMSVAGEVRDCDIALKLVAKSKQSAVLRLEAALRNRRKEGERILVSLLGALVERKSSQKWRAGLEYALERSGGNAAGTPVQQACQEILRDMAEAFVASGTAVSKAKPTSSKLHEFRLSAKKFRYTLDLFAPLYGSALDEWQEGVKRLQTLLGDVHDCETARGLIASVKSSPKVDTWLQRRQKQRVQEFKLHWAQDFGDPETVENWMNLLQVKKPAAGTRAMKHRLAAASLTG